MKPFSITARADRGNLIALGVVSLIALSFGFYICISQPTGWQFVLIIGVFLAVPWVGLLSVKFSADESEVRYSSIFRHLVVTTADITSLAIVAQKTPEAPMGTPRFYLILHNGTRQRLNVKVLPRPAVKMFCTSLMDRGVSISVQDAFAAKLMARQIFK